MGLMKKVEKTFGLLKIHGVLVLVMGAISKLKWAVMFVELRMVWFMLIWWEASRMKNQRKVPLQKLHQNLQHKHRKPPQNLQKP